MKFYRTVKPDLNTADKLFSGYGGTQTANRWNHLGERVIYCSNTLEASVCERANHSLLTPIASYNDQVMDKGKKLSNHFYESVNKVKFALGEIEFIEPDKFINIDTDADLKMHLDKAGLPVKTINELRVNKIRPPFWTRELSKYLSDLGVLGFVVPSARTNNGKTVAIFEPNISATDIFTVNKIVELEISAVNTSSLFLKKGELAEPQKIYYKCTFESGQADILTL